MERDTRKPNRATGLVGALGGVVILVSYFLPSYLTVKPGTIPPYRPTDYILETAWDAVYRILFGAPTYDGQTGTMEPTNGHVLAGVVAMTPMIMAALILLLGMWALFSRPGPARVAIWFAAVTVIVSSLVTLVNFGANNLYLYTGGNMPQDMPLLSLGVLVYVVGVFIALVSSFLAWQHRRLV